MRRFVQALSSGSGLPASLPAHVGHELVGIPDRYNISAGAPAGVLFIHDGRWRVADMAWGFIPSWEPEPSTRYSTQTARLQRAPTSRLYRRAFATRRCAIVMNGYYKWDRESSPRQPYFIQAASGDALAVAGLWSRWGAGDGEDRLSFAVLTQANADIPAPLFPDGPCFLRDDAIAEWMQSDAAMAARLLARTSTPRLEAYRVSRRVANRKLDDYSLLEPLQGAELEDTAFDPDELDDEA